MARNEIEDEKKTISKVYQVLDSILYEDDTDENEKAQNQTPSPINSTHANSPINSIPKMQYSFDINETSSLLNLEDKKNSSINNSFFSNKETLQKENIDETESDSELLKSKIQEQNLFNHNKIFNQINQMNILRTQFNQMNQVNQLKMQLSNNQLSNNQFSQINLINQLCPESHPENLEIIPILIQRKEFINLITSQCGSRFMQKIYKKLNTQLTTLIFNEILPFFQNLMVDNYANYFTQKFFGILNKSQRILFLKQIGPYIPEIANSHIGTYPLQSLIGQLITDEEKEIVYSSVYPKILEIINNSNGVHVIEKMIEVYSDEKLCSIYDIIVKYFIHLTTNADGLFICKKMILKNKMPFYINKLVNIITKNLPTLIHKQYGNYSIQVAIETWPYETVLPIFYLLSNNFIEYACEKYSSNVIEKYLEHNLPETLKQIIDIIVNSNKILTLLKNPYGNFVLLKAIKLVDLEDKLKLILSINANIEIIANTKYYLKWKYIISTIVQFLNNNAINNQKNFMNLFMKTNINENNFFDNEINLNIQYNNYNNNNFITNQFIGKNISFC